MPELPEVETVVRTLAPHVEGWTFGSARLLRPSTLLPLSLPLATLEGLTIKRVWRRAKLLMLDLSGEDSSNQIRPEFLIFHLRMTGRVTPKHGSRPDKHTRCIFPLSHPGEDDKTLFFDDIRTFGKIFAATRPLLEKWDFWATLGLEPLEMSIDDLAGRLIGARPIKTALLDQKTIAGIGNIYADEALHLAHIHPLKPACSLTNKESGRLMKAIKAILGKAISQCGSSIRDYRDANGNVGAFQNSFAVYGRGGEKCRKCGSILQKIKIGGRSTVFCEVCQKLK